MHDPTEMALIASSYLQDPENALALVTLVEKTGSSYRQPGARLLIHKDGSTVGGISGGCLESDLAALAMQMEQKQTLFSLEVVDTRPIFGCQGTITLWIELLCPRINEVTCIMEELDASFRKRNPIELLTEYAELEEERSVVSGTRIVREKPAVDVGPKRFYQQFDLQKRVVVVGAHPDAGVLIDTIRLLGWGMLQVVPGAQRKGWVNTDSRVEVLFLDAEHLVERILPDESTAVVVMTHNLGRDISYVSQLLGKNFGYIGLLGSQNRRQELMNHLFMLENEELIIASEKLHCPIGLDIGSESPQEIAISIVAEIRAAFSKRKGGMLKDQSNYIHPSLDKPNVC